GTHLAEDSAGPGPFPVRARRRAVESRLRVRQDIDERSAEHRRRPHVATLRASDRSLDPSRTASFAPRRSPPTMTPASGDAVRVRYAGRTSNGEGGDEAKSQGGALSRRARARRFAAARPRRAG